MATERENQLERLNENLKARMGALETYIANIETLVLQAPTVRPRPNTREMENLTSNYERIMKIYASVLETQRKILLMQKEDEDRGGIELDELYHYLKTLGPEDFENLRGWMKLHVRGKVQSALGD